MQRLPSATLAASETGRESLSSTDDGERTQLINRENGFDLAHNKSNLSKLKCHPLPIK